MNLVILTGYICGELNITKDNGVQELKVKLAVPDDNGKGGVILNAVALNEMADYIVWNYKNGQGVMIYGHFGFITRDKNGSTLITADIIIDRVALPLSWERDASLEKEFDIEGGLSFADEFFKGWD